MLDSIANEVGPAPDPTVRMEDGEPGNELTDANAQAPSLVWKKAQRANSALQRERTLLAKVEAKYGDAAASDCSKARSRNARIHALSQTRNQLLTWTEEQLAEVPETKGVFEAQAPSYPAVEKTDNGNRVATMQKLYKDYLGVRRSL